jgi:hypothetical protein
LTADSSPREIIELFFINHHQASSIIIKHHQASSSIIKHHQASSIKHQASIMSAKHQAPPTLNPKLTPGGFTPLLAACTRFNNKTWQEYQDWKTKNQSNYEQIYQRPLKCIYGSPREMSHKKMPPHAKILVIEMNNDENQIKGIGVIQNQTASEVYRKLRPPPVTPPPVTSVPVHPPPVPDLPASPENSLALGTAVGGRTPPNFRIFSDRNYTRYIYIGNEYYATKEELERNHTADAQYINEHLTTLIIQQAPPAEPPETTTIIQSLERLLFKGAKHMKRGSGITLLSCGIAPSLRRSATSQLRDSATSR